MTETPSAVDGPIAIVPFTHADWPAVEVIYAAGIATGHATFESATPSWERFDRSRLPGHRLLAVDAGGQALGWAAVVPVSARSVYAGVVEHSVYVDPAAHGRGVGRRLLEALARSTEDAGIWTLQAVVFPENVASLAVHRSVGFRVVGTRERIGRMTHGPLAGTWRDVVFIERRSTRSGL